MQISRSTRLFLNFLLVLAWIIFIGLCIEAGALLVNSFLSIFIMPEAANNFWKGRDYLSALYGFDKGYFMVITGIMIIVAVLKAILFYLIIKMAGDKNFSFSRLFSAGLKKIILNMAILATGIAFFSQSGAEYTEWLHSKGLVAANIQELNLEGAGIWFFMAVIFFITGLVIQKGIEIQQENELTI